MSRWTKEEIEESLAELRSHIDYEVGDWVETCHLLPGIVQKIVCHFDDDPDADCIRESVQVFYPSYAIEHQGKYCGGSDCSIDHCGVHKITPQYAMKLLSIGEDRLRELWDETADDEREWSEIVEEEFAKMYKKDLDLYDN